MTPQKKEAFCSGLISIVSLLANILNAAKLQRALVLEAMMVTLSHLMSLKLRGGELLFLYISWTCAYPDI